MLKAKVLISSDTSIVVEWGSEISESVHDTVMGFYKMLLNVKIEGIIEFVPTYCSVMIHYDPFIIQYAKLKSLVEEMLKQDLTRDRDERKLIEVPVVYGGAYGPDLEQVALYNQLTVEEVIRRHSSREYLIYMLGFTPGFAYMGGMDETIATPRLKVPRTKIPAGAVGIAGQQTGIYPIESPGGWQLIGQTPLKLYQPQSEKPTLFEAGQRVRFVPITLEEFEKNKEKA